MGGSAGVDDRVQIIRFWCVRLSGPIHDVLKRHSGHESGIALLGAVVLCGISVPGYSRGVPPEN